MEFILLFLYFYLANNTLLRDYVPMSLQLHEFSSFVEYKYYIIYLEDPHDSNASNWSSREAIY